MKFSFTDPREDNATGGTMTIVLDGYNAPVRWVLAGSAWRETDTAGSGDGGDVRGRAWRPRALPDA